MPVDATGATAFGQVGQDLAEREPGVGVTLSAHQGRPSASPYYTVNMQPAIETPFRSRRVMLTTAGDHLAADSQRANWRKTPQRWRERHRRPGVA